MSLDFLHGRLAVAMVLFAALASVYGLVEYIRNQGVSPNYWGIIVVGNLLAVGQGILGVILALGGGQPARGATHLLYGVVALGWIPLIGFVSGLVNQEKEARRETLLVALVSLFQAGIALRALTTATVAGGGL